MNSNYTTQALTANAPSLIHELRNAFDARLMELHAVARERAPSANPEPGHDASPRYHIDFLHGALQVTAIYDASQDRFTQLVARQASEAHHERPSFTVSLFL